MTFDNIDSRSRPAIPGSIAMKKPARDPMVSRVSRITFVGLSQTQGLAAPWGVDTCLPCLWNSNQYKCNHIIRGVKH